MSLRAFAFILSLAVIASCVVNAVLLLPWYHIEFTSPLLKMGFGLYRLDFSTNLPLPKEPLYLWTAMSSSIFPTQKLVFLLFDGVFLMGAFMHLVLAFTLVWALLCGLCTTCTGKTFLVLLAFLSTILLTFAPLIFLYEPTAFQNDCNTWATNQTASMCSALGAFSGNTPVPNTSWGPGFGWWVGVSTAAGSFFVLLFLLVSPTTNRRRGYTEIESTRSTYTAINYQPRSSHKRMCSICSGVGKSSSICMYCKGVGYIQATLAIESLHGSVADVVKVECSSCQGAGTVRSNCTACAGTGYY